MITKMPPNTVGRGRRGSKGAAKTAHTAPAILFCIIGLSPKGAEGVAKFTRIKYITDPDFQPFCQEVHEKYHATYNLYGIEGIIIMFTAYWPGWCGGHNRHCNSRWLMPAG